MKMEWISLVRQQLEGHDKERQQWYKTLTGIVEALDQVSCIFGNDGREKKS